MTDIIRWGVISTANIGRKRVIPAIQASRNGTVTAVASRDADSARAFADGLGIEKAYGSYEELLADPHIDAIYNPLPNSLHAEWSIQAAEAGKPTLCEKPLASNAEEGQTIIDAFREHDVPFAEAFMYRFHPQTERVKQIIDAGQIGDIRAISASFCFNLVNDDNIRLSKDLAGGALMDVGCYCVNVIRLMTGDEPHNVAGFAKFGEQSGVDEVFSGVLHFKSGVVAHFDCSLRGQHNHGYTVIGSKGKLRVDEGFVMPADRATRIHLWENIAPGEDEVSVIDIPATNHYTLMAEDFADALLNKRPPRYPGEDAVATMRVIDALLESAQYS